MLELIDFIYDDNTLKTPNAAALQEKAIVCPKNNIGDVVNVKILSAIKGQIKTYLSKDDAIPMDRETSEAEMLYPMEYLNTITFPGFSPHELQLKVGLPIILLRNVNLYGGLCNSTRMIVRSLMLNLIEAQIITRTRIDYLGCIRSNSDVTPFGDVNRGQSYRRKLDIKNLDGNIVELTMWDELAKQFNKEDIKNITPLVIIAVSSCRVAKYKDVQLSATSATHYYINPRTPEAEYAYKAFKEKYDLNPPLQVSKYRSEDPEQEKQRTKKLCIHCYNKTQQASRE
ncbi:DNA helicase [Tanacetum coccineum]|uniref:DNA helicase n=1 Tax=Tanacetum coccineum TaxID=301880 RepID=A0ABQ4XWN2_9ASTR